MAMGGSTGRSALIIGGSGFLGGAITRQLLEDGWETDVLSRGNKPTIPGSQVIQADRTIQEEWKAAMEGRTYDLVVDCAGYKAADIESAIPVLKGKCAHYVFISTDYVYASSNQTTYPIRESAATHRDTPYAEGKLDCEALLLAAWNEDSFPVTILRPPHIMGAGKELGCDQVLGRTPDLLSRIRRGGQELQLLNDGQLLIQPVWSREIALCISHLAGMERSWGHIFTFVGPEAVTARRYYEIIAEKLGVELTFESLSIEQHLQSKPGDRHYVRHRIYDTSHLTQVTGYQPHLKLEAAIQETLDWMLAREAKHRS
ncbi:NAD-dependent epimerase/dehydratase family protein [Paenibacillus koleovorans]|uniref:NAD-dependent epimerase/dehydratase family protein n=1 Tax=Paenibacillus koleovorans TaxID=121608 RepID=UPI0013E3F774|nr:NAD-dependent epimerase/dehydratase family protein [Paenibacillus koleovorans]